ncbi:MAG TPA: hypothetical protein VII78_12195 [Myxococcota bacterium]
MTLFEYLAVSFSVVLSLAVVRILGGISDVFARGRIYWVHALWVVHQLLFVTFDWWNIWSYRDVAWNYASFLAVIANPSLVYYQAAALVPASTAGVQSWREHFYRSRRQFFGSWVAWALLVMFNSSVILSLPLQHPARISQVAALAITLVGVSTARPSVHAVLALLMALVVWPARVAIMLSPGALIGH